MSIVWMYVIVFVRSAPRPSVLRCKTLTLDITRKMYNHFFIPTIFIGTIDFDHFIPTFFDLGFVWGSQGQR